MENLLLCLTAILPLLLVVLIGYLAKRAGLIREEDVPALLGAGLEAVYPAGASIEEMADFLRRRCAMSGSY